MKNRILVLLAAFVFAMASVAVYAQTAAPQGAGGRSGPGSLGGFGRFGGSAMMQTLVALGELNLTPDFTLSTDQKQKIQAIRDDFKAQEEKFRSENADAFKALEEQRKAARDAGGQEAFTKVREAEQALQAKGPKSDDAAKQIQAVLTADQLTAFQAKEKESQKQREEMMQRFGGGRGGAGAKNAN